MNKKLRFWGVFESVIFFMFVHNRYQFTAIIIVGGRKREVKSEKYAQK